MNHGAMASAMKERARVEDAPELRVLTESRRALTWSYVVLYNWEASTDEHEVNATYILLNDQSSLEIETERLSDLVVAKKLTQTDGEVQRLTQCVSTLIETLQDGCAKMH